MRRMAKVRRNAPCPCGSGRKYKKCCAHPTEAPFSDPVGLVDHARADAALFLKRLEASELIRVQQQGLGRPMIAAKARGHQFVAVANTIHYSKDWKFPSDFLSDYIRNVLGPDWGNSEIAKPLQDRHPILQWYDRYCQFQRQYEKRPDGTYVAAATGVVYCYIGLAYNLYLLKHNVELQTRLLARLKNPEQFQGAYYELMVANFLIRAGFELALEDETDESSKALRILGCIQAYRQEVLGRGEDAERSRTAR
jgi:hypothetical protein